MFIDAHNHLQDPRFDGLRDQVIESMKEAGIEACVVNGTSENDWHKVAKLADKHPRFIIPSFGLHPWKVDERSSSWLENLRELLEEYPQAGIGECGLDRWMKDPDLEAQHEVFRTHLQLAEEFKRPLSIHCLRAWGSMLEELKAAPPERFLLHSFGGSQEIANELVKLGAYFSFSGYFLFPKKKKIREVFTTLPPDRILVESDAPDMSPPFPTQAPGEPNHPKNVVLIAEELSKITGVSVAKFHANSLRFFA